MYKHWPAKTVTEADDHLFCLLTMNHHPLHINDVYAAESQQGRNVVVGPLVYSLALGMSVADVSGKAIANLATEELSHPAPVFHGDTLFAESEVLEVQALAVEAGPRHREGAHARPQAGRHARGRVQARRAGAAALGARLLAAQLRDPGGLAGCYRAAPDLAGADEAVRRAHQHRPVGRRVHPPRERVAPRADSSRCARQASRRGTGTCRLPGSTTGDPSSRSSACSGRSRGRSRRAPRRSEASATRSNASSR